MFVQWLYTSTFNALGPMDSLSAYLFGFQLGAVGFRNQAIHRLYDTNLLFCTIPADIAGVMLQLDIKSGLRRLVVDAIALGFLTQELDVKAEEWKEALSQRDVWSDVMSSMARQYTQTWKCNTPEQYYEDLSDITLSADVALACLARCHPAASGISETADSKAHVVAPR